MNIKTSTELVRYIRHQLAGSEWQDVKTIDEYVKQKIEERLKARMELVSALLEGVEIDYSKHERLRELLTNYDA